MRQEGVELIARSDDLSVVGLTEVIRNYPDLRKRFRRLLATITDASPELLITVDFPGFNLRLAEALSRRNVPTLHLVSPQIWAWRTWRIRSIRRAVDELVVLFPFEVDFYRDHGIGVRFFGHPGVERLRSERPARVRRAEELRGADRRPIVAWLPGSRRGEVRRHLPVITASIRLLSDRNLRHAIAVAPSIDTALFDPIVAETGCELVDASDVLLEAADVAIVKSGTSTLEAAVIGTPFAVVYRVSAITAWLARRLARVRYIAMPNILADREIVREYVQDAFTPENLRDEVLRLLDPVTNRVMREDLNNLISDQFEEHTGVVAEIARFTQERFLQRSDRSAESA